MILLLFIYSPSEMSFVFNSKAHQTSHINTFNLNVLIESNLISKYYLQIHVINFIKSNLNKYYIN